MAIMGIIETANAPTRQGNNVRPFAGQISPNQHPESKVWMNVGYPIKNAEGEETFISLPFGQAVDTMKDAEVRGQNEDWIKQQTAKNLLLKEMQAIGASLKAGEEKILNLQVRIRRVKDAVTVPAGTNEYVADFAGLVQVAAAAE